jgi:RNA 2',3'-cyclic 3'-phosphodiesterase
MDEQGSGGSRREGRSKERTTAPKSKSPNVRLFVGVQPPEEVRAAFLEALKLVEQPREVRPRVVPLAQVHMTLQFIGSAPARDLESIIESVERSAAGVGGFTLKPLKLLTFPPGKTPRLVAVVLDAPAGMLEIRRRLVQRLAHYPRREDPERFIPHMTLCRYGGEARPQKVDLVVELPEFEVGEIVLFRSVLKPTGAEYSRVVEVGLGANELR